MREVEQGNHFGVYSLVDQPAEMENFAAPNRIGTVAYMHAESIANGNVFEKNAKQAHNEIAYGKSGETKNELKEKSWDLVTPDLTLLARQDNRFTFDP